MNITVKNVSFGYTEKLIFNNLNIDIECSDKPLVILGPSGSGKTTLLKLLGGLLKPNNGEIIGITKTAFMFQEPRLLPWLTILDNVRIILEKDFGKVEAAARAKKFLSLVSLDEKANAYPAQLSGGEAQRVSMARAFAWSSNALFADEPFQSLDIPLRKNLMDLMMSLCNNSRSLIMVTHDLREAVYMGGKIIVLGKDGSISTDYSDYADF